MTFLHKMVLKSGFLKSLIILASGSIIGSLIIAVCEIARTWIFTKESVGIYTFLITIPLTFISITSLRYDISIVIEEDERKSLALVKLSSLITVIVSILVTIGFILFIVFFHKDYIEYLYVTPFIPIITLGYGSNNILNAYNNRYKEYSIISKKYVMRTAIQYIGAIILGIVFVFFMKINQLSVLIMIAPYALGLFAGIRNQAKGLFERWNELKKISRNEMYEVLKKHRRQAYFSSPALFVNSFSFSIITFIIEDIFDTATLAFYSISNRVLGMPIGLISGNVAKVYIEEASREYERTGKFENAFKKSVLFLIIMAFPMFLVMYFIAPPVCRILLGSGWDVAGNYIKILALMFSFRLIGTAISQSLAVCNKQGWELIVNGSLIAASLFSGLFTRITAGNIYYFLKLLCISRSACYIGLILLVFYFAKGGGKKRNYIRDKE